MAAGIDTPKSIMAHGWWTNEGQKISKSLGNVIDPFALIDEFGVDPTRYFLMREVIFGNDGNYSRDNMISRINSELANKIGNLAQRTLSFIAKIDDPAAGVVPQRSNEWEKEGVIIFAKSLRASFDAAMDMQNINLVLDGINELADKANIYIDHQAPWTLKKTNPVRMNEVLYVLVEAIRYIAIYMQPFTPESASKILDQLGIALDDRGFDALEKPLIVGSKLGIPEAVFPRI